MIQNENSEGTQMTRELREWQKPAIKRIGLDEAQAGGSITRIDGATFGGGYYYTYNYTYAS